MKTRLGIVATMILLLLVSVDPAKLQQGTLASLYLTNIRFVNADQGWMLGSTSETTYILHTVDGGETWHQQYKTRAGLFNIEFTNTKVGWAVGSNGTILHTTDGGSTWEAQASGSTALLAGLAVLSPNSAWVSGANGTLLFTKDGGKAWAARQVSTKVGISDVAFADAQHGLAVGYGTVLSTKDGGNKWTLKSSGEWKQLSSVLFANGCPGWITAGPVILRTTDAGDTLRQVIPPAQGQVAGLSFIDAQHGWVATSRGEEGDVAHIKGVEKQSSESFILSTSDGGASWREMFHIKSEKDHSAWILDIFFTDLSRGWAVGRDGLVLKTVDGGGNWKRINIQ